MNVQIDLPEIEGFEYTGEYRRPRKGEWFISSDDNSFAICASYNWDDFRLILKKKAPAYKKVGKSSSFFDGEYVEIKALEDAMHIIKMMNRDTDPRADGFDNYAPLQELIK